MKRTVRSSTLMRKSLRACASCQRSISFTFAHEAKLFFKKTKEKKTHIEASLKAEHQNSFLQQRFYYDSMYNAFSYGFSSLGFYRNKISFQCDAKHESFKFLSNDLKSPSDIFSFL